MKTRRRGTASASRCVSLTASSTPLQRSNSNYSTEMTIHRSSMDLDDCTSQKQSRCTQKSPSTLRQTRTRTTQSSTFSPSVSLSPGFPKAIWLIPILMLAMSVWQPAHAQSQFSPFEQPSHRFLNYANGKSPRDIMLSVVKNISEDVLPGTPLLNFRAEDRNNPSYNFS